jgi:hypothetical protein
LRQKVAILKSLENPTNIQRTVDDAAVRASTGNLPFGPDGAFIPVISINTQGAFVQGNYSDVYNLANGGNPGTNAVQDLYRAITLIHELGHALTILGYANPIFSDGGQSQTSFDNSSWVAEKCFGYRP